MKKPKQLLSVLLAFCLSLTLLPAPALAAGSTKTIFADTFTLEISNVYAMDSWSKSAADGYFTNYNIIVPAGATVKCTKSVPGFENLMYLLRWPFNDITFPDGINAPRIEKACDYDDTVTMDFALGKPITLAANNTYSTTGGRDYRYYNVMIQVVDAETLVQFGGPKPPSKPKPPAGGVTAVPSKTEFVVVGKGLNFKEDAPQMVTQAYSIHNTNYLQLRAIATLLNRTSAQFNVGWDGQYVVIEPGKPFTDTVTGSKMRNTTDVRQSTTKFKMNGEVFSFSDARLINGDTNYIQLREFAQKMTGTASQFNVYWDSGRSQAMIQPGVAYTGSKHEAPVNVLQEIDYNGTLPEGNYYLKIFDKYVYPVQGGQYWLELKTQRPDKPYTIKRVGDKYSIGYEGTYIMLPGSLKGQLQSTTSKTPHYWSINLEGSYCSIRDYKDQNMLVSASGARKADGTKINGWPISSATPDHAKIRVYQEVASSSAKTQVKVSAYPTKTNYQVGEGFDSTGVKAVVIGDGAEQDVSGQLTFYTAGTVELTPGRPFQTTGTKVVELRYHGDKFAEYTITVK